MLEKQLEKLKEMSKNELVSVQFGNKTDWLTDDIRFSKQGNKFVVYVTQDKYKFDDFDIAFKEFEKRVDFAYNSKRNTFCWTSLDVNKNIKI